MNRDPDFLKVVWELALELTGRTARDGGNDDAHVNGDDGYGGKCDKYGTSSKPGTSTAENDLLEQRAPRASTNEGQKPNGLKIRNFRSVPSDFDGTI